jgi:hypothetical protein
VFQLSAISDVDEDYEDEPELPQEHQAPSPSAHQQQAPKKSSKPAGTRRAHMSDDVLTFFSTSTDGDKRTCTFCL